MCHPPPRHAWQRGRKIDTDAMPHVTPAALIDTWLRRHLKDEAAAWLHGARARVAHDGADAATAKAAERALFIAFGAAARHVGRDDLALTPAEVAAADAAVPGWDPSRWSCDQAARVLLVLGLPAGDASAWLAALDRLFAASGFEESVALYQALAVFPHPERLRARASEGVRCNIRAVFTAVALGNPYPAAWLDDDAWNQLVLKCLFVDAPLHRVVGIDRRANPALTRMLCDYAHERWAAKRPVHPELWRPVGRMPDDGALADLARVLGSSDERDRQAGALALASSTHPEAKALLARHPELASATASGQLSWDVFVKSLSVQGAASR
jgi:hypothetical protein